MALLTKNYGNQSFVGVQGNLDQDALDAIQAQQQAKPYEEQPYFRYADQPYRPNYVPGYDKNSMRMEQDLEGRLSGINVDQRGMNKYRQEAMRSGPSAWAQMAGRQQDELAQDAQNKAGKQSAGQAAEARSQLAMRGGINSGARERIAQGAAKNYMDMSQDIGRQATTNKTQIGMNDEQNRINQLQALPGMENAAVANEMDKTKLWGQAKQFDVGQMTAEQERRNAFNMGNYHEQMQAWGAGKQANATANAGKK